MRTIFLAASAAIAFCLPAKELFSQNFDSVEIKTHKINDRIFMLEGEGVILVY